MNAWRRLFGLGDFVEARSGSVDSAGGDSPLLGVIPPPRTEYGVVTWREAMKLSAVSRSMDILTTMLTSMTISAFQNELLIENKSPAFPSILATPNLDMDRDEFIQRTVMDYGLHGEFVWLRQGVGQTVNLLPTSPEEMTIVRERNTDGTWGRTRYGHMGKEIPRDRVIHKMHTVINGEHRGTGPIQNGQVDLRAAIYLAKFQEEWFDSNGIPTGVLTTDQQLNKQQHDMITEAWNNFLKSSKGRTVALSAGMHYEAIHLKPAEAQMLEVSDAIDRKIARLFGMPAFDLLVPGGTESRTYMNLEQSNLRLLITTLAKYMNAIESGFNRVIPFGVTCQLNEDALLRLDQKTRADVDEQNIRSGMRDSDELRARDKLKPIPKPPAPAPTQQPAKTDEPAA